MVVEVNTENPDIDPFYELKVCGKLLVLTPQAWVVGWMSRICEQIRNNRM